MKKQMGDYGVFWAMVWQQKVEKIVMVTKLKEEGVRVKMDRFFIFIQQVVINFIIKPLCNGSRAYIF